MNQDIADKVGKFIDRIFWALLLGVSTFMANQVSGISQSVADLNVQMAAIMEKISNQEKTLDDHGARIRHLEE